MKCIMVFLFQVIRRLWLLLMVVQRIYQILVIVVIVVVLSFLGRRWPVLVVLVLRFALIWNVLVNFAVWIKVGWVSKRLLLGWFQMTLLSDRRILLLISAILAEWAQGWSIGMSSRLLIWIIIYILLSACVLIMIVTSMQQSISLVYPCLLGLFLHKKLILLIN